MDYSLISTSLSALHLSVPFEPIPGHGLSDLVRLVITANNGWMTYFVSLLISISAPLFWSSYLGRFDWRPPTATDKGTVIRQWDTWLVMWLITRDMARNVQEEFVQWSIELIQCDSALQYTLPFWLPHHLLHDWLMHLACMTHAAPHWPLSQMNHSLASAFSWLNMVTWRSYLLPCDDALFKTTSPVPVAIYMATLSYLCSLSHLGIVQFLLHVTHTHDGVLVSSPTGLSSKIEPCLPTGPYLPY